MGTCLVSGSIVDLGFQPVSGALVDFSMRSREVIISGDIVVIDAPALATTAADGSFSISLAPAAYRVKIFGADGVILGEMNITVPDQSSAAFSDLINLPAPQTMTVAMKTEAASIAAAASASVASSSAASARSSADEAEQAAVASAASASNAGAWSDLAALWAEQGEDTEVDPGNSPGMYSARHWAAKAAASVASINTENFQPKTQTLTAIGALGTNTGKYLYTTGVNTWAEGTITSFMRSALNSADALAAASNLGLSQALAATCLGVSDWNLAVQNGYYRGLSNPTTNAPGSGWYLGHVVANGTGTNLSVTQTVWQHFNDGPTDTLTYRRSLNGGVWSAWYRVRLSEEEIVALIGIPTEGTTGQVLAKASNSDFDMEWVDPPAGGASPSKWDSLDTFVVTAAAGKFMNTGRPYSSSLSASLSVGIFMPAFVRFSSDVAIDQIGFRSGATGSNVKTLIYKLRSDGSGISDLVHTAAAVASENGYVMGSEAFTFLAHEVYLIGILVDVSVATYRSSSPQNMKTGYTTASTSEQYGYYWSGLSFAAPPSTIDLASASPNGSTHLAFMRIAA